MAPADLRKEGTSYDLPLAVGIMAAGGYVPVEALEGTLFIGELSLDGCLRPVHGILPVAVMIPVLVVGIFFKDKVEQLFGNGLVLIGCMLILTALLLTFSYYIKPRPKEKITWWDAFIIGLSQAVAVLPGLSRSGTTIATGLMLGDKKEEVAKFSFLMVIVPILGEAFLSLVGGDFSTNVQIPATSLIVAFLAAFITGCIACKWMLSLVKKGKLIWFAVYCAIVGALTIGLSL